MFHLPCWWVGFWVVSPMVYCWSLVFLNFLLATDYHLACHLFCQIPSILFKLLTRYGIARSLWQPKNHLSHFSMHTKPLADTCCSTSKSCNLLFDLSFYLWIGLSRNIITNERFGLWSRSIHGSRGVFAQNLWQECWCVFFCHHSPRGLLCALSPWLCREYF
jgi:hypothetical protein